MPYLFENVCKAFENLYYREYYHQNPKYDKMKKHIKPSEFLQQLIVVFGIFMMLPTITLAQENSRQQIEDRIRNIDNDMRILTYEKEVIGLKFESISNFSMKVRPILLDYNQIVEAIKLKEEERPRNFWKPEGSEAFKSWYEEREALFAQKDNYNNQFRNRGGVKSYFNVQCNTIEELQNEYTRLVEHYKDQKKEYDNIALELGNLNNEKHKLTADLNSIGGTHDLILDLEGCWSLRTGKYTSHIEVEKKYNEEFVGYLTMNNLNNYIDGQIMFRVTRVSYDTFRGMEITYIEGYNGQKEEVRIPMKITINSDGNFLTWTSDETVNMQRCY